MGQLTSLSSLRYGIAVPAFSWNGSCLPYLLRHESSKPLPLQERGGKHYYSEPYLTCNHEFIPVAAAFGQLQSILPAQQVLMPAAKKLS